MKHLECFFSCMKENIKLLKIFLGLLAYYIFSSITHIYIPCIFHLITGFYCPGCGVTRMLIAISHGDFYKAFRYNQLLFITFPFFVLLIIDLIICNFKGKKAIIYKIPNWLYTIYFVICIIFMIIRNIFPYFSISGI